MSGAKNKNHGIPRAKAPGKRRTSSDGPGRPRTSAPALPIYDSMGACQAATGIPLAVLKMGKKKGCLAFRSNRVDLAEFLKWVFAQEDSLDGIDWGTELTKEKAKREKIRRLKDERQVIERGAVKEGIVSGMAVLFSELDRIFLAEFPPACKGLKEVAIRGKAEEAVSTLRESLREKFGAIAQLADEPEQQKEAA